MIRKISVLFLAFAMLSVAFAQYKSYPIVNYTGDEVSPYTISSGLNLSGQRIAFSPVQNRLFTWTVNSITDLASGYDLQSNGSTQQLWYDLTNGYLHAAYMTSQEAATWSDRTTTYFFSDDNGANWIELGNVPPAPPVGAKSGFPSIIGLSNGAAVITSHHNGGDGLATSKLHVDSGPAEFNFTQYNPGNAPNGQGSPIWGKLAVTNDDNIVMNSSISGGDSAYINVLNTTSGAYNGWDIYDSDQAETYALATSPAGVIGHAYIGGTDNAGKAFYRSSVDGGLTWSTPIEIFTPVAGDTTFGTLRGIDVTFAGETPVVAFESIYQILSASSYFPGMESYIYVWSPAVNGGVAKIVVDSLNVPYYPNQGTADVMGPLCRPVLSRAETGNYIFMGFSAAGPDTATTVDGTRFFEGWFTLSSDGGSSWSAPERFTPRDTPLLDFRFVSISPVAKVTGNTATVHLSAQGDPVPGSQVNGSPAGITAKFFHFTTDIPLQVASDVNVTFQVDMGVQAFEGNFPAGATVVVRGDFQSAFGDPGGDWQGNFFQLSDVDGDTIYTGTFNAPAALAGNSYNHKFVIVNPPAGDNWESTPNRPFTVTAPSTTLPVVWFNNDDEYTVVNEVTNTINFIADISDIRGVGVGGAFDDSQDSLRVEGLDWDNLGKNVTGNRRLINEDIFNPGIYTTTLTFTSSSASSNGVGDSTKWKFKAYPDGRFANTGWETTPDRWHIYQADGAVIDLPTIVPSILPLFGPIASDVQIQITVDMTGATNRYNGLTIPLNELEFVGMRGAADFLGSWASGGNWVPADTTTGNMKVLTNIGGNLWRTTVTAPSGTNAGQYAYKFAAMYPGADTINGGSSPLDNENPNDFNHTFVLSDNEPLITLWNNWADITTDVKEITDLVPVAFELGQNYPNPFNPSTTIKFSVPEAGLVTLRVFNLLGQEVATLLNSEKTAGVYEATFDASTLSSGIYFYTLEAKNFSSTKKMVLLK